jgi:hypothetical protein
MCRGHENAIKRNSSKLVVDIAFIGCYNEVVKFFTGFNFFLKHFSKVLDNDFLKCYD